MIQVTQRSIPNGGVPSNDEIEANTTAPAADEAQADPWAGTGAHGAGGLEMFNAIVGTPRHLQNFYGDRKNGGDGAPNAGHAQHVGNGAEVVAYSSNKAALPPVKIGTAADVAKAAGLDLSRYADAELRKLDVVNDGKLDANEARGIVKFADVDGDGKISPKEQQALDYLLLKDTSKEARQAFADLHLGNVDKRAVAVAGELAKAEADFKRKDQDHDKLVDDVHKQEQAMRDSMYAEGFLWTEETPAQIREQMAQLTKAGQGGTRKMEELEWRLQYAEMRQTNKAEQQASYDSKEAARKVRDDLSVVNLQVRSLAGDAARRVGAASVEAVRAQAGAKVRELIDIRGAVENDPQVRAAFVKFAKGVAIQNAVRDGKLDGDHVDMNKVKQDIDAAHRVIEAHTQKLEKAAGEAAKLLEDPKFREKLALLPDDERTQILTDLQSLIADTEAGYAFFKSNIWPGLNGKSPKNAEVYDDLKVSRHGSKLALNLTGVWGALIAKEGGIHAMKLMDAQLARSIGVQADQMPKIYKAMEIAKTDEKAAREFLANDPALKKISTQLNAISGGIAIATAIIAAHDLVKDPKLRNVLAAAKSGTEIAEVLARLPVPESIARYSRIAGRFGPPLDLVIGGLDGFKSAKRNDIAGAIGGFTQSAGGLAGTAGVIAAAVGATGVGLPLAVVGSALAVLGSLITTLWGDSPTQQWLKDNAPEYLK